MKNSRFLALSLLLFFGSVVVVPGQMWGMEDDSPPPPPSEKFVLDLGVSSKGEEPSGEVLLDRGIIDIINETLDSEGPENTFDKLKEEQRKSIGRLTQNQFIGQFAGVTLMRSIALRKVYGLCKPKEAIDSVAMDAPVVSSGSSALPRPTLRDLGLRSADDAFQMELGRIEDFKEKRAFQILKHLKDGTFISVFQEITNINVFLKAEKEEIKAERERINVDKMEANEKQKKNLEKKEKYLDTKENHIKNLKDNLKKLIADKVVAEDLSLFEGDFEGVAFPASFEVDGFPKGYNFLSRKELSKIKAIDPNSFSDVRKKGLKKRKKLYSFVFNLSPKIKSAIIKAKKKRAPKEQISEEERQKSAKERKKEAERLRKKRGLEEKFESKFQQIEKEEVLNQMLLEGKIPQDNQLLNEIKKILLELKELGGKFPLVLGLSLLDKSFSDKVITPEVKKTLCSFEINRLRFLIKNFEQAPKDVDIYLEIRILNPEFRTVLINTFFKKKLFILLMLSEGTAEGQIKGFEKEVLLSDLYEILTTKKVYEEYFFNTIVVADQGEFQAESITTWDIGGKGKEDIRTAKLDVLSKIQSSIKNRFRGSPGKNKEVIEYHIKYFKVLLELGLQSKSVEDKIGGRKITADARAVKDEWERWRAKLLSIMVHQIKPVAKLEKVSYALKTLFDWPTGRDGKLTVKEVENNLWRKFEKLLERLKPPTQKETDLRQLKSSLKESLRRLDDDSKLISEIKKYLEKYREIKTPSELDKEFRMLGICLKGTKDAMQIERLLLRKIKDLIAATTTSGKNELLEKLSVKRSGETRNILEKFVFGETYTSKEKIEEIGKINKLLKAKEIKLTIRPFVKIGGVISRIDIKDLEPATGEKPKPESDLSAEPPLSPVPAEESQPAPAPSPGPDQPTDFGFKTLSEWTEKVFKELPEFYGKTDENDQKSILETKYINAITKAFIQKTRDSGFKDVNNWTNNEMTNDDVYTLQDKEKPWKGLDDKFLSEQSNEINFLQKLNIDGEICEICFIGDIHGGIHGLLRNLWRLVAMGYLDDKFKIIKTNFYLIFLGDYVDRGKYGLEVLYTVFLLKLENWFRVFLLRGNHEEIAVLGKYTFFNEAATKIVSDLKAKGLGPQDLADAYFQALESILVSLRYLTSALFLGFGLQGADNILQCCHGGINPNISPLEFIKSNKRFGRIKKSGRAIMWGDFNFDEKDDPGFARNVAYEYGRKPTMSYLNDNKIKAIFRGHQHSLFAVKMIGESYDKKKVFEKQAHWRDVVSPFEKSSMEISIAQYHPIFTSSTASAIGIEKEKKVVLSLYDGFGILKTNGNFDQWKLHVYETNLFPQGQGALIDIKEQYCKQRSSKHIKIGLKGEFGSNGSDVQDSLLDIKWVDGPATDPVGAKLKAIATGHEQPIKRVLKVSDSPAKEGILLPLLQQSEKDSLSNKVNDLVESLKKFNKTLGGEEGGLAKTLGEVKGALA